VRISRSCQRLAWPGRLCWQAEHWADSVDSDAGQPGHLTNPRAQNGA